MHDLWRLLGVGDWRLALGVAESVAKTLAIVGAGAWAFWRYVYQGEYQVRVGFTVDVNFVTRVGEDWLVELLAVADNKGLVTHRITQFSFYLRCLYPEDAIEEAEKANFQTNMPHVLKRGSWLPSGEKWGWTFIRPGICNQYRYVTVIPARATAALLTGRFDYSGKDGFATAVKVVKVPEEQGLRAKSRD